MSTGTTAYRCDRLPLEPIRAGTSVLVSGPVHDGARTAAMSLLSAPGEGTIVISTDEPADRVVEDLAASGDGFEPTRAGIVDCVGDGEGWTPPPYLATVSSPEDLTGIGIRYSNLYERLYDDGVERVRTGLLSVTTLLTLGKLKQVSRFVHTLKGRIATADGLGVFLVDPATVDERAVNTIGQFCDGRIDVRTDDGPELRTRGLRDQPSEWTAFDTPL